jgi:hypothetical protein
MAKVLRFKEVNSDVNNRMKEFEKMRMKLKFEKEKASKASDAPLKENKSILKSISSFFSDNSAASNKVDGRKFNSV